MTATAQEVLDALAKRKNVLLSGPPGTGKTHLVSQVVSAARSGLGGRGRPALMVASPGKSLTMAASRTAISSFPNELEVEWITFHQGYAYEDFIIGKRPVPSAGGVEVKPFLGTLMSIALDISRDYENRGCLLVIDEISRANASQVFGEFITMLDPGYRKTIGGRDNPNSVSFRLPGVAYIGGMSEPLFSQRHASPVQIPTDWKFPENFYVLATMNSVDKAAIPLDAALTRRFHRFHIGPDLRELSRALNVPYEEFEDLSRRVRASEAGSEIIRAEHAALMLLDRLNTSIATDFGEDFELGHGLLWSVVAAEPEARWDALIDAWEHFIKPQLLDRYAGRQDALKELLYINGHSSVHNEVFSERSAIGLAAPDSAAAHLADLTKAPREIAVRAIKHIAT